MRNAIYLCVILFYIFHNVNARKRLTRQPNEKRNIVARRNSIADKLNASNFVDMLIRDAKKIAMKRNAHKNSLRSAKQKKKARSHKQTTVKTVPVTEKEGFESNYDILGVNDENTDKIIQSHNEKKDLEKLGEYIRVQKEGVDLDKLAEILHSNKVGIDYKKVGKILRQSNSGLDFIKSRPVGRTNDDSDDRIPDGIFRSVVKPSAEEETELLFDLEDEELMHPLF